VATLARRYYLRGRDALERGELETAEDQLRAAVELVPAFAPARIAWAIALCRRGESERAAQRLRAGIPRALTRWDEAALYAALGDALVASGELDPAADAYEQAELHPGFADRAAAGRAKIWAKRGRYPEAIAALRRAADTAS
jgi:tetratricopeptide (TPR) repeat protein